MLEENLKKYIKKIDENISEFEALERLNILRNYIFVSFDFVKENKREAFYEYLYSFILEDMGASKEKIDHSPEYEHKYSIIKERIDIPIDELKNKEIVDFDYENEVLVIAFRLLKYFNLDHEKLFLKFDESEAPNVRVYNDYRSNVFTCVLEKQDIDYVSLKLVEKRVNLLRKEIEYLNDFILNYNQEHFLDIFRITRVVFDKQDIEDNFIQGEVKFTASFRIIQKLIGPLYLNKESYGMRELIQNAVDACLKKNTYEVNANSDKEPYCGKIEISYVDKNVESPCIIVKDNGIGMDEKTILNKFLTIGESAKEEETSIGKFGIGILATFLLADKMKFKTCCNGDGDIYESEEIEFEAVKREEQFINIKKYKNENEISGTEITLILKKDLLENKDVVNYRSKIVQDQFWIINDLFGKNKFYGSLWYGYPDEYDKICKTIPEIVEIKEEISSEKLMLSNLDRIKEIVKKMEENTISTDKNQLEEELKKVCKKALVNIEKIEHKTAYSMLKFLASNCWYLLNDTSPVEINFFSNGTKLNFLENLTEKGIINKEIIKKEIVKDGTVEKIDNINTECKLKYFWSDAYEGNVFCNNMLIPSKYEFETNLAKAFQKLPTILVEESEKEKIEIDLARERCKLVINGTNYEEDIIKEILINCLGKGKLNIYERYLQPISWLYYINESGCCRKVIKSKFWLLKEKNRSYFMVYLGNAHDGGDLEEKQKIEIVNRLCAAYGKNIVIEFVNDTLHMNKTFNQIEWSDLFVAAIHKATIVFNKEKYEKLKGFSTNHMRALALAAKNIKKEKEIDVEIKNQLRLNREDLEMYKNADKYEEKIEDIKGDVFCLNYDKNENSSLSELPDNVEAIIKLAIDDPLRYMFFQDVPEIEQDCPIFKFFKDFTQCNESKRKSVWNGFQEGIMEVDLSENDDLVKILLKEYDVT